MANSLCRPDIVAAIVRHLEGPPPTTLAHALRKELVSGRTYRDWRRRAAAGEEPYATLVPQVEDAREAYHVHLLERVEQLGEGGTKDDATRLNATKWQLEKLFRDEYDPPRQIELSGREGGPIETNVVASVVILPELDAEHDTTGAEGAVAPDGAPKPVP